MKAERIWFLPGYGAFDSPPQSENPLIDLEKVEEYVEHAAYQDMVEALLEIQRYEERVSSSKWSGSWNVAQKILTKWGEL